MVDYVDFIRNPMDFQRPPKIPYLNTLRRGLRPTASAVSAIRDACEEGGQTVGYSLAVCGHWRITTNTNLQNPKGFQIPSRCFFPWNINGCSCDIIESILLMDRKCVSWMSLIWVDFPIKLRCADCWPCLWNMILDEWMILVVVANK